MTADPDMQAYGGEADKFALNLSGDGVIRGNLGSGAQHCHMLGAMCMNLPPWRRVSAGLMHVMCIIPNSVGTDVQPYLQLAADELQYLGTVGLETKDTVTQDPVRRRVRLSEMVAAYQKCSVLTCHRP